jgi:hypothetical protein
VDPSKDKRLAIGIYSVAVSPVDGSVWGTALGFPGYVVRVAPGPNPTATAITEIYEPRAGVGGLHLGPAHGQGALNPGCLPL